MTTTRIGAVSRVDYAHGIFVTFERMDPAAEEYTDDQRWYYAVWSSDSEVEDSGYARTKSEAKEYADVARDSLKYRADDSEI